MYHYPSPPSGWSAYDGYTPPSPHYSSYYGPPPPSASASASAQAAQAAAAAAAAAFATGSPHATPRSKKHAYRASFSAGYSQQTPQQNYQYSWQPPYDRPEYFSTPRKQQQQPHHDHVSPDYYYSHHHGFGKQTQHSPNLHHHHQRPKHRRKMSVPDNVSDDGSIPDLDDYDGYYYCQQPRRRPSATTTTYYTRRRASTNHYHYPQTSSAAAAAAAAAYDDPLDTPKRSRARRASTFTRPTHSSAHDPYSQSHSASKPKPSAYHSSASHGHHAQPAPPKSPPRATEADAIHHKIPPGYSIKNWNPKEAPILLLGSVFDANSLGKWIYDWTAFHHGATAPMADVAGDLWLLLIKLAGKVKRADECAPLIRSTEAREMVEDFLESGERLWARFKRLLKACEHFMWKAAKREHAARGGSPATITMGRNAGCEFVDSIFGRDRELENTEKLMNSVRLWNMRFDANCGELLREVSK
ncbi:Vegetative cell wall protein gp1 [Trichophyton interdigitale]|nr:Vegetative cell wall protein gp1 [Trichophyton interdigitale]KAG5217694.1 Vegetative cell wall protein gp1 [Trichophyton interdigitale]KAG8205403.1 Vegetative cell wall protein gp1 [Trichophyton interdigitale]